MKNSALILAAALLAATSAGTFAQDQSAPPAGGGRGGALRAACQADIAANCAGKTGREIRQCLNDNQAKLSDGCKTALTAAPAGGGGGGGGQ